MTNLPATNWNPPDGNGQFTTGTAQSIVDPSNVSLVDPSAVQIVDSGVTFTQVPQTTWTISDGS